MESTNITNIKMRDATAVPSSIPAHGLLPRSHSDTRTCDKLPSHLKPPPVAANLGSHPTMNITPDMPTHNNPSSFHETGKPASEVGSSEHSAPSPAFASFFGPRCSSQYGSGDDVAPHQQTALSLQKHDFFHHHKVEPFPTIESPISKPSIISGAKSSLMMPSMPSEKLGGKSPKKRCLEEGHDDVSDRAEDDQPHTPKYRCMLQELSLNSPALSSASNTPEEGGASKSVEPAPFRRPPNIPSFVRKKDCIMETGTFESLSFSAGNSPMRTPDEGLFFAMRTPDEGPYFVRSPGKSSSTPTTASSSFHSLRSNRTSIGHQNSPFKMLSPHKTLPPRLERGNSQGSNDQNDSAFSPKRFPASSPFASSPTRFASSSPMMTSSPSHRVVPLKILSRDGSPAACAQIASATAAMPNLSMDHLPYDPSTSSQAVMSSPLIRSLDQIAKKDSAKEDGKDDLLSTIPSLHASSPKASGEYPQLPRIKLTPRSKSNYASLMLDLSPSKKTMPSLKLASTRHREEGSSDREDVEMDSLLSGFGHHKAGVDESRNAQPSLSNSFLGRVESEESEMAAIAREPLYMPSFKPSRQQTTPMKSITLKPPESDRDESVGSPSFLPKFLPGTKSRSLFDSTHAYDPVEGILRADAIAEAAKSNEELTDDESDSEEPGSDFLLCSPKVDASKMLHGMEKRPNRGNLFPLKAGARAESPSCGRPRASSIGSIKRRNRSFSSPAPPTIAEEGFPKFEENPNKDLTSNESTLCSLFDCNDHMKSPLHSHQMPPTIGFPMKTTGLDHPHSSLLSMASLCGLDIVDDESDELRDKVSASLPSESSQLFKHAEESETGMGYGCFRRMSSELSSNSLGLSVDSAGDADQRDLFTPPITTMRNMYSPPPLPKRAPNFQNII